MPIILPRISIVTPCLNQAAFIERTMDSVLSQDYDNLEYIVIDGGSSDGSVDVIKRYAHRLKYWQSEKDAGQAAAINRGLESATGLLVAFQNSDDIYRPGAFHAVAEAYLSNPTAHVYFGSLDLIDECGALMSSIAALPFSKWAHLYEGMQVHNQASFFSAQCFQTIGPLDNSYRFCFDYEFICRLARARARFHLIRRTLGAFRLHTHTKTASIPSVGLVEHEVIRRRYGGTPLSVLRRTHYCLCRLRRLVYHLAHGNIGYLTKKMSDG